ncbi:MAG TPA: ATP-grasp domain-containing protein [Verrucomicrobiae bacterium]|nr:ATP-grasp domain-containing protein [Verrucomicrobiae bacterium]
MGPVYVGTDPVPALGSQLAVLCADACGIVGDPPGRVDQAGPPLAISALALLEREDVRRRLAASASQLVVWKPSMRIAECARQVGVPLANAGAAIARRLENKVHFTRTAPGAWLPIPPAVTGVAAPALTEQALRLRGPWVVQLASGYSGRHTRRADTEQDLTALLATYAGRSCRVSSWIRGDPVTVTGVVGDGAVALGVPCRQLTGLAECTPYPLGSCGNDFGAPIRGEAAVLSVAARAAAWLQREGHRGIFGADLVVAADDTVFCIEVNPRLVASVPLWNLSARDRGEPSLLARHLGVFVGAGDPALPSRLECHWSQLILHNLGTQTVRPGLASGTGRLSAAGGWERAAPLAIDGPRPGEVGLIVRGRARPGHELARVVLEGPCLDPAGALLPHAAQLVRDLRDQLGAS